MMRQTAKRLTWAVALLSTLAGMSVPERAHARSWSDSNRTDSFPANSGYYGDFGPWGSAQQFDSGPFGPWRGAVAQPYFWAPDRGERDHRHGDAMGPREGGSGHQR